MPLDAIMLNSVVKELSAALTVGRIDKIQQPEPDEIIIPVRSQGQNHKLLLTANANSPRITLTAVSKPNPAQAPMFCMLLRKHLSGGRITTIIQPDYERIVEIHAESPNEMGDMSVKRLIIEIMGKHSNIILVDATGTIMDSIRHVSKELSSVREILPGRTYIRPPSFGKSAPWPVDDSHFLSLFEKEENSGKSAHQIIYQSYNGISPVMGSEICLRAGITPNAFSLNSTERSCLLSAFTALYENVEKGCFSCHLYEQEKGKRDIAPFEMLFYGKTENTETIWNKSEKYDSPSEMIETYYRKQDISYRMNQKSADLRKLVSMHIDRCQRKEQIYKETLLEIEDREQLRRYGELITAYIYTIPEKADKVKLPDFYDQGQEAEAPNVEIPLDPSKTPAENAQSYFKRYNKAKRTFSALQGQIKTNEDDLAYLDSILASLASIENENDINEIRKELAEQGFIKKKPQKGKNKGSGKGGKSKPLHFRSSEGFDIYVGKNNTQNDELTMKFARSGDLWLHTKDIAGSHVIIHGNGKEIPEKTILEGAMLAAYHSKGRQSSQVPVDYTFKKYVRKPKGAKPGFVIYDYHKTLYVTPAENELPLQVFPV